MKPIRYIHLLPAVPILVVAAAVAAVFYVLIPPVPLRDDTDPPEGVSGMDLHIDARTGCHYLSRRSGGLTPRLQADGTHLCEARP
jgi:hypothetical protein